MALVRRITAGLLALLAASLVASTATPAAATQWQVTHIGLGIRCDFSPCLVQGSLKLRVKGLKLPPRTKAKAGLPVPSHDAIVDRHWPNAIRLVVAGRTFRYDPGFVDQLEEVEPNLEFDATSHGIRVRGGRLLKAGSAPGVLTFRTKTGTFRIPVTVRIVRVA